MNAEQFLKQFHDYLAPKLDTYEQAIYLYIIRHSRLVGKEDVVIGFKSARKTFAFGIGKKGTPLAENTCYGKLRSLESKGCLILIGSEYDGTRLHAFLPDEIKDIIPEKEPINLLTLDEMDFFAVPENRKYILQRESHQCFYCLRKLNNANYVIEHAISRPEGDNSYKNVVAACRKCNNRKGSMPPDKYLRVLYRDGFLGDIDFEKRIKKLELLFAGRLKPSIENGYPVAQADRKG